MLLHKYVLFMLVHRKVAKKQMGSASGCIRVGLNSLAKKVGQTLRGVRMGRGVVADTKMTSTSFGLETGKLVFLTNTCGRTTNHIFQCTVKAR